MKKIILLFALCALVAACGGDDGLTPTPQKPPTNEEKTAEVKAEDIVNYFNLDKNLNVYQALQKAKEDKGKKTIAGKEITITDVNDVKRDDEKGTFTLKVKGTVGSKAFEKEVDFTGFAQKPTNLDMARRAVATWKTDVDYQKEFDFDALYRLKSNKFDAKYMAQFIDLSSSSNDGTRRYTFTPEDWAQTEVSDVRYVPDNSHAGHITFNITYKGIQGQTGSGANGAPSVAFDKNMYYKEQITVKTDAAKGLYMRGVYEYIDVFRSELLNYDKAKYAPIIVHKVKSDSDNSMSLTIKLTANDGKETELAQFNLLIAGFKPLSDLNKEWSLGTSSDLGRFFGSKFRASADGDKSAEVKFINTRLWLKLVQMSVRRENNSIMLTPHDAKSENGNYNVTAWYSPESGVVNKDIYLVEPRIEIISAKKEGIWLYINYKLIGVNDTAVDGVEKTLNVHLIQP